MINNQFSNNNRNNNDQPSTISCRKWKETDITIIDNRPVEIYERGVFTLQLHPLCWGFRDSLLTLIALDE